MLSIHRHGLILVSVLLVRIISIQCSYVRHLSLLNDINRLTYSPSLKWLYVASIDALSIYDQNLTLLQHVSILNSSRNDFDPCSVNPCQCLRNSSNRRNDLDADRYSPMKGASGNSALPIIDRNNYNLILYFEQDNTIQDQPYLIDCWSLQSGSCIVRNALNLTEIYNEQNSELNQHQSYRLLFNTESKSPNHLFPFRLKLNKCKNVPMYLFLTSTLKDNRFVSSNREQSDNHTDFYEFRCLEQAQRRTIALRAFVHEQKRTKMENFSPPSSSTITKLLNHRTRKSLIINQIASKRENSMSYTKPILNNNQSNLLSSMNLFRSSSTVSMVSDEAVTINNQRQNSGALSPIFYIDEQNSFSNINDYCPEQFSVLRSIYTDFFERESPEKFRLFQDIVYDEKESAIYIFTNQQERSKIIRLCEGQISFRHYIELPIQCGQEYNLVQKVKLIKQQNSGEEYLVVIASKSNDSHHLEPSYHRDSALCIYKFDRIRHAFVDSVIDLAKGNVSLGMAWLHGESVIPQYPTPYGNLARCSTTRDATYLMIYESSSDILSQPLMTFPSDQLTSLQGTSVGDDIVLFLGTADGKIKKISVQPLKGMAQQFDELFVHYGEMVLRDLILSEDGHFLFGATKNRLFQVDLHDCDRHRTCFACLATKNPYCEWQTNRNRCTVRLSETSHTRNQGSLLIGDNCPSIIDIKPNPMSKSKASTLQVTVESVLDDPESSFFCSFGFSSFVGDTENEQFITPLFKSHATKINDSILCQSPTAELLSKIDHDWILLHLFYRDIFLAEKRITFYDCSSYETCSSCLNNTFDCSWDLLKAHCIDHDVGLKNKDQMIQNTFIESNNTNCPRFNISTKEIFIPDGNALTFGNTGAVNIFPISLRPIVQKHFRCVLTRPNGIPLITIGRLNESSFLCDPFQISYGRDIGQEVLTFSIEWSECMSDCTFKTLEAVMTLTVNVYKCKFLADSCGSCILLPDSYRCSWCETDKSCRHEINASICELHHIISSSGGICPDPRILQIYPHTGPERGQTPLRIYGSSLGRKPTDIHVMLIHTNASEYPCRIQADSYIVGQSFFCQPPPLDVGLYMVRVTVYSVLSKDRPNFIVVKPKIQVVSPTLGPRSGGTLLSVRGKHLNIGSQMKIFVGDQRCYLINEENTTVDHSMFTSDDFHRLNIDNISENNQMGTDLDEIVHCRTSKLTVVDDQSSQSTSRLVKREAFWIGTITILIDNFTETYSNITYSYTEDPQVYNLSRHAAIYSGGLLFIVRGMNFDSIQTPKFFLERQNYQSLIENCSIQSSDTILCHSPTIRFVDKDDLSIDSEFMSSSSVNTIITSTEPVTSLSIMETDLSRSKDVHRCIEFKFGFIMDEVEQVRNTSNFRESFRLCPDPLIYPFDNNGKRVQYRYDYLTIEGEHLLEVATINDYLIMIGSYPCNITSISDKQIVCQPTNGTIEKLSRRKRNSQELHSQEYDPSLVRVMIGRRVYTLGSLMYLTNSEKRSVTLYYIIASVCGFLLTLFIIIVSILFRRINDKRARQLHRLQHQIDTLEMRVARECKEAFAELQTDIGEITNDLSHSGVPYHDYRTYCMKVLFPHATDEEEYMMLHNVDLPVTYPPNSNRRQNIRQGLQLLSQSLYNRHFLLVIIRTLEADKIQFRLQDRMQFASLISILLEERIDYFTEILKLLLKDLIDKSLQQDRNNSKILLRSNAAVAEKMLSNWFSFLLYDYIKNCFGSPLYILFQSIKQQIQKGPIDCVTNESRYSLSEDKLLRQHVDYSSMIVYVVQVEEEKSLSQSMPVPIKVLSCDSITQVKEKIVDHFYKNIPFSKRPSIDEFDLEWRIGSQMRILRDGEKLDHADSNDFVQIQTLASYKVHDGARLFLSLKPGVNSSTSSSVASSQATSVTPSNIVPQCHSINGLSSTTKRSDQDPQWQCSDNTEYQILLHSTLDLMNFKKEVRINHCNPSEPFTNSSRIDRNIQYYHLVKPTDREDGDRSLVTNKLVSEVYLTRLLATKGSLQQYIDTFFDRIFCLIDLPTPIKYFFDFLDEQANLHQITDSQIIHTWKSNSLPLRFFVNIIKNPDFIFDVQKTNVIDASLSVIAQMFMDSCAVGTHQLTKDSPSSKLLFYRDVQKYKKLVEKYYDAISTLPPVPTTDLHQRINSKSERDDHIGPDQQFDGFNRKYALFKLYFDFLTRYKTSLRVAMVNDIHGKQYRFSVLFDQIIGLMEGFELNI